MNAGKWFLVLATIAVGMSIGSVFGLAIAGRP